VFQGNGTKVIFPFTFVNKKKGANSLDVNHNLRSMVKLQGALNQQSVILESRLARISYNRFNRVTDFSSSLFSIGTAPAKLWLPCAQHEYMLSTWQK